jgi:hypothetical protein
LSEVCMVSFALYGLDGNDYEGPLSLPPKMRSVPLAAGSSRLTKRWL